MVGFPGRHVHSAAIGYMGHRGYESQTYLKHEILFVIFFSVFVVLCLRSSQT